VRALTLQGCSVKVRLTWTLLRAVVVQHCIDESNNASALLQLQHTPAEHMECARTNATFSIVPSRSRKLL